MIPIKIESGYNIVTTQPLQTIKTLLLAKRVFAIQRRILTSERLKYDLTGGEYFGRDKNY